METAAEDVEGKGQQLQSASAECQDEKRCWFTIYRDEEDWKKAT